MKIVTRFACGGVVMIALLALVRLLGQQTLTDTDRTQWLLTGGDFAETRYSPLKEINAGTVGQLGLAWYYDTDSEPGALEATPILADGVLYTTLTWDVVIAVDARTGKLKWRYDPHIPHHNFAPGTVGKPNAVRIGPTIAVDSNRGPGFSDGKVYVGLLDGRLIALDAATGNLAWEVHTSDPNSDYSITGAPRIVKGKVVIGNGGADWGERGYVSAYDAATGKFLWRFYTVPGDPSKPFENDAMKRAAKTWKGDTWYKIGGGGTVWDAMAYDPQLDLLYLGTGNGGPWDRNWRSPGGGDNLYLSSIVAVHADTGKFAWYFQETPGDQWDYTASQDMILADVKINGKLRKVIMQAPKNGFFYVLDRENGKFISAVPFAYVTWATGVDPKTGRPLEAPGARYDAKGTFLSPSNGGAHNWQTMSFNPGTGLAYLPAANTTFFYKEDVSHFIAGPGVIKRGLSLDPMVPVGEQKLTPPPADRPKGSFLLAWNPATQKEAWRFPNVNGSTMTTAGNLVFSSSIDGHFMAFSADKGEQLWQAQLVPGFGSPITYSLDGKQYVSVLAGRSGHGRLYTFALGANLAIPAPAANSRPLTTAAATGKTTQNGVFSDAQAMRGQAQYAQKCAACHMADLTGSGSAIPLAGASFTQTWSGHTLDELYGVISTTMPQGNAGSLSPETYADIVAFILKANGFAPGQDEMKSDPEMLRSIAIRF
jgi:quinohemoprotein ethanol dehydrogenase